MTEGGIRNISLGDIDSDYRRDAAPDSFEIIASVCSQGADFGQKALTEPVEYVRISYKWRYGCVFTTDKLLPCAPNRHFALFEEEAQKMLTYVRTSLLISLVFLVGSVADECPRGDISGDCQVDFEDVWSLAHHWLDPVGADGDIVGLDGVNLGDFAALARNWGKAASAVVINEIHCDPDVKTDPLEFIELHNRTTKDVDISGWNFRSGITFQFAPGTILPAGGYIAVAQSPERIRAKYGAFMTLLHGPCVGRLSNSGERIELYNAQGQEVDQVDYQLGFPWPMVGDSVPDVSPSNGTGHSMQLVNPFIDNDLGGSWRSGFPTPTGRNFLVYLDNTPPHMRQVKHRPEQPKNAEDVTITVKATDSDDVNSVTLSYQLVEPGSYIELNDPLYQSSWTSVAMTDDGAGGDEEAGDDIYTVVLDASIQTHRRLVRYRITAVDNTGATVTGPYADDTQPNFAYFVYDGVPLWRGAIRPGSTSVVEYGTDVMRSIPVYHLISKKSDVETCTWYSKYAGDEYKWSGTLVYDGEVYDHIRYRARGGVWRYAMGKNMWKFDFNRGHSFQARDDYGRKYDTKWDKLNFSACIQQGNYWHRGEQGLFEAAGFKLFNLAGVESPKTHWLQFRIIDELDETGATQYVGDFWGLYLVLEQMDGRFLDEHGLPDGNLYKMDNVYPDGGDLNNQGPTAATDKSDLKAFIGAYKLYQPAIWWLAHVDVEKYFSYRTIVDGIHHYDIGSGKNYFYYLSPVPDVRGYYLWSVLPWDIDLTWNDDMFDCGNRGNGTFKKYGLWDNSTLRVMRNNRIRDIRDLLFNTDQGWKLLDDLAAIIDNPAGGPSMVDADRAMWDYNPIMVSSLVNSSKAGQGRFYQIAPTKDFPGMVQIMKSYVGQRATVGDPRTSQEPGLDPMASDPSIPYTPTITYTGSPGFPVNTLTFESTDFDDPEGIRTSPGTRWRIAEVSATPDLEDGVFVPEAVLWRYFKGTAEPSAVPGQWRELNFTMDANWFEQNTPIGYGETFTNPPLTDMRGAYSTIYLRKEFNVIDLAIIEELIIEARYDDGFNIWINGVYAGGRNVSSPELPYDASTGIHSEHRNFEVIARLDPDDYLVGGRNILAVQVLNESLNGSADCFIDVRLTAELSDEPPVTPPVDQRTRPKYEIEPVWENSNWNTYLTSIRIPASVVKPGHTYRVRCKMRDDTDRWSHWSEPIEFVAGEQLPTSILDDLRITEVMYDPPDADTLDGELDLDNDEFEYIELKNIGDEVLNLIYLSFVQGITFDFSDGDVTSLGPGQFMLLVRNKSAFESRYDAGLSGIIAGQYIDTDTKLANGGETIELLDKWNGTIVEFSYSDRRGWPLPADGSGHSLVPLTSAIATEPGGSLNYGGNWRHSAYIGGSPGQDDPDLAGSVVVNEVMPHTDYNNPAHLEHDSNDWIELYNTTPTTIGLSGWYLSDDKDEPAKWAITSVNISGNGRVSFDEVTGFHNPITTGFGLDKAGEVVMLSHLPGTSQDRVVDYVRFKGEENLVSLGRYPDGGAYWLHQPPSRDLPNNTGVLDIVIDEVMYHPMDPNEEYVELYNPTTERIYLENDAGAWRLDDENTDGYTFDAGTYIEPGGRLVVAWFDPATEPARLSAFIAAYGAGPLAPGLDIVGPMPGNLSNGGERIALKRPQASDDAGDPISWVVVDEVIYGDVAPWPIEPDGAGAALQRIHADQYHSGNDPANWRPAAPGPGAAP